VAEKRTTRAGFAGETRALEVTVPDGEPEIWGADARLRVVGTAVPRVDGALKATGRATYTADVAVPGLLHARLLRAPVGGGTLRGIDVTKAARAPGVVLAKALRGPGSPLLLEGQDLALVVADTEDHAEDAVRLCAVEIQPGRAVVDVDAAMAEGAPKVHASAASNVNRGGRRGGGQDEVDAAFRRAEEAMARAEVRLRRTYRTQVQTHSPLEPHGVVVRPDPDGGLTVWASTQGTFTVRDGIADALKLDRAKVRVITEHMGGGFGTKFGPSAPGSGFGVETARAALELGRPVRCMLTRREQHLVGGNRPSSIQTVEVAAARGGKVVAYTVRSRGTSGIAQGGAGVSNPMVYDLGITAKDEVTVCTHAGPGAAFRAPGHPQGAFALESALDEAAAALGIDPLDLRLANDRNPVRRWQWAEGAKRFGWAQARFRARGAGPLVRGVGLGAAIWYSGGGPGSTVLVTANRDGSVEVRNGAQDIGTGTRTVLAVIVAEVLGLDPAAIQVRLGHTEDPSGPGSGGSTTAPSLGPCARAAAEAAKREILGDAMPTPGTWREACARMDQDSRTFSGGRAAAYATYHGQVAGCQFAEVEVDVETGVVRVLRVLAMQDCGRVIDRLTAESQVIGAVVGGISYALFEDRVLDPATGRLLHGDLEGYRIAGPRDVPEIEAVMTDVANAGNSVGMMGLGEPPAIPTAAAIANAVAHAIGARVRELPITPARVLAALEEAERSGAANGGKR
jgi:xanthine dehydrogenase YagR molybdenum-binding subunit